MKLVLGLLDRIVFTLGVLVCMQLPHFVDQYSHRLGGYSRAAQEQLDQYQAIARANFNGDLEALIAAFSADTNAAVAQTGRQVARNRDRAAQLAQGVRILETRSLGRKLIYLAAYGEPEIVRDSLRTFKPGLPFTPAAIGCGLAGGVLAALLLHGLLGLPRWAGRGVLRLRRGDRKGRTAPLRD